MWWPWGSNTSTGSDAVQSLDPSLRKFLEDEKPREQPQQPRAPEHVHQSVVDAVRASRSRERPSPHPRDHAVPTESQYQDGRYADLWKTYRPLAEVEAAIKTDQDRLTDLKDTLAERKRRLREAASENCALESIAVQDCYDGGGAWARLTLCRQENRAFDRCYEMQAKFLRALGYVAAVGAAGEDEVERIQMHADALYRRMLEQERLRQEARDGGLPAPEQEPVMSRQNLAGILGGAAASQQFERLLETVAPEARAKYAERLKDKDPEQRELEMRLIESERQTKAQYSRELSDVFEHEKRDRLLRKQEGRMTFSDRLKTWWGWDESEDT